MSPLAQRPTAANNLRNVLRAMMRHAIEIGLRADDPTRDVRAIRVKSDGFHSWNDDEIAQFEKRHPRGTPARLALALLLYTGYRPATFGCCADGAAAYPQRGIGCPSTENGHRACDPYSLSACRCYRRDADLSSYLPD